MFDYRTQRIESVSWKPQSCLTKYCSTICSFGFRRINSFCHKINTDARQWTTISTKSLSAYETAEKGIREIGRRKWGANQFKSNRSIYCECKFSICLDGHFINFFRIFEFTNETNTDPSMIWLLFSRDSHLIRINKRNKRIGIMPRRFECLNRKQKETRRTYSLITQNNCFQIIMSRRVWMHSAHTMQTRNKRLKAKEKHSHERIGWCKVCPTIMPAPNVRWRNSLRRGRRRRRKNRQEEENTF